MVKSINSSLTHWALPRFSNGSQVGRNFRSRDGMVLVWGPPFWKGHLNGENMRSWESLWTPSVTLRTLPWESLTMFFFSAPNYGGNAMILARYWNFRVMWAEIRSRHPLSLSCIRLGSHSIHQIQSRLWKLFRCVMLNYGLPKNAVESNQNHDSWLLSDRLKSG